ncbi:T9SS type A sorting domain-containing protein [Rubricoccus marinus]|uniref:Secretion system C-terminal sorting domain-containing protein n=1 Tax=Rubricoccus marinus TaxID=716817 RepID=A0A259U2R8_9BACT|nr:T9SS type A sorting domain-containing protein [Rubricoccus marinus]OZC04325.1 hypothetical protein BSZ36_15885 [Rubricoccus marinus]
MMRNATLALAALALFAAPEALAQCTGTAGTDFQRVTVRDINAIPQANVDQLNSASAAGTLDIAQIQTLLTNDLEDELVEFTAVVLSNPRLSGLASAVDGIPGRIHVFVRDITAATAGPEGMGIQIVDGRSAREETQNLFVGDEITVCGFVSPFDGGGKSMQISPVSVTNNGNPVGAGDPILDPITVSIDDFHDAVDDLTQIDWSVYGDYNGQYVRLVNTTVVQGVQGARPNVLFSDASDGGAPQTNLYDTSVCFRNDRDATYFPPGQAAACIDDDFVPPATGTANVQGFLLFTGDTGGFNYSTPNGANFVINPFEDTDFEVASAPPTVSVNGPATVPGPSDDVTITATIVAGDGTIASAVLNYRYVVDGTEVQSGQATLTRTSGDEFTATIPARTSDDANGAYVFYNVVATDTEGGSTTTDEQAYLVFEGAINSIALIQTVFDATAGAEASPLATGNAVTFDLDAVVQSIFQTGSGNNWVATIQDDEDLAPFTGIWIFFGSADPGLAVGDRINISEATVTENFNVTQLTNVTFTETGSGAPYGYVEVPTSAFNGSNGAFTAEQHEGMLVSFDDVTVVSTNADAPNGPFGEFLFSSDGTTGNGVRADDYSNGLSYTGNDPDELLDEGNVLDFVRGPLYYSFFNYKVTPVTTADIGAVISANEGGIQARTIRIDGTYPNPVTGMARVEYELDAAGPATLRLYDVTGREVATLASGDTAAGAHVATLNAAGLASGVYVLRLEAAGEVTTARIAVVR